MPWPTPDATRFSPRNVGCGRRSRNPRNGRADELFSECELLHTPRPIPDVGLPRADPGRGENMILAQLSDPHIVAAGKLFRCPMQGTAPDAERARLEFDTAPYLAHAVATLNALVPRPDIAVVTGDLVDHGEPEEYEQ